MKRPTLQNRASGFRVERLGVVMRPDPAREEEAEGVLNPAAARGPDGELYLFPRLVGKNNYSRIGIARVIFNNDGDPEGVERLGIALEPEEPYELRPRDGTGGVEDPRVTFVQPLGLYVMAYAAWGPRGPRVALAVSETCRDWERIGLVDFQPDVDARYGVIFNEYDNKDAAFAPTAIEMPDGTKILGMFHRPLYTSDNVPHGVVSPLPGIWFSGTELELVKHDIKHLRIMNRHRLLLEPANSWEALRIGLGTPPIQTRLGHMVIYHGVRGELAHMPGERSHVDYSAGVVIFRPERHSVLRYRSSAPILFPEVEDEADGTVNNVVFPTGIDKRSEDAFDVYYGVDDKYICVARIWIPGTVDYNEMPSAASQ